MKSSIKVIIYCLLFISHSALAELAKVQLNGYYVEYELAVKGKHTILLEAGCSAGLSDWEPFLKSITKHAKVIRYSRMDNGGSA